MKSLIAAVLVLFSMPSFAGVITYDFTRLVLGDEADQTSLIGQITFDENETQFNMNTWLSFFFQLKFDNVSYNILEEDIAEFDLLIFGIPTWYYGEAQCDWDDFFPELEQIDFNDKLVAIFGCGDQEDYAEYFLDAMGMVRDIVEAKGAILVGQWSTEGYDFEASKGMADDNHFVGLGIDEDRQPELTDSRVKAWCKQIHDELCLAELA